MVQKKAIRYEMTNMTRVVSPYVLCHTVSVKSSAKRRSSKRPPNLTNLGRASTHPPHFAFVRPRASIRGHPHLVPGANPHCWTG